MFLGTVKKQVFGKKIGDIIDEMGRARDEIKVNHVPPYFDTPLSCYDS